jgi:hypothetical protein
MEVMLSSLSYILIILWKHSANYSIGTSGSEESSHHCSFFWFYNDQNETVD